MTPVKFCDINVFSCEIALVSGFSICCNLDGKPSFFKLQVAIDRNKAKIEGCEISVHIPAKYMFHSEAHTQLMDGFKNGDNFVPVRFQNLKILRDEILPHYYTYHGMAKSFTVAKGEDIFYGKKNG